jgi:protein TonB
VPSSRLHLSAKSRRNLAVGAGVGLLHGGLFALAALGGVTATPVSVQPIIDVELVQPVEPPPPPPRSQPPAPVSGGGAPAAPSRIHTPPTPKPVVHELPAPVVQAPKPELTVGVAPVASPTPGMGQGGQGTGTGTGTGDGDGPGSGGPPRFIAGPTSRQIADAASAAAKRARVDGMVTLRCTIRLDTRLENCRVLNETPTGLGFGEAAVRVATERFRFSPPTSGSGRPIVGAEMPLGIRFNLGGRRPPSGPLEG